MEQSYLINGYRVSLNSAQDELTIEAEHCETLKLYAYTVTNTNIADLNIPLNPDVSELNEFLKEGLAENPSKISIEAGPVLILEKHVKFGKSDRIFKVPFKLEEQKMSSTEKCEHILAGLMNGTQLNPVESQMMRVLKGLVESMKRAENNIGNLSRRGMDQSQQISGNKVNEKITELEKNISGRLEQIEKKAGQVKNEDMEGRFAEVNKKLESFNSLLTNVSRNVASSKSNETSMQNKLDEAISKVEQLQKSIKESEEKSKDQANKAIDSRLEQLATDISRTVSELDKTKQQVYKLEALSTKIESLEKSLNPSLPPPSDVVKSVSFTANNYEIKLFKTTKDLVVQARDLATSADYTKTVIDSGVRGLSLNTFTDTASLYDAIAELVKTDAGANTFTVNEGKMVTTGLKKKCTIQMEKAEAKPKTQENQEPGASNARVEQLASDISRIANELDKTKEQICKLEVSSKRIESLEKSVNPSLPPPSDVVKSESFIANNYEIKLFKTTTDLVVQARDLATSTDYTKTVIDSGVKGLSLNTFTDTASLYDGLAGLIKSDEGISTFTVTEGKMVTTAFKKKCTIQMEKVEAKPKNQESQEAVASNAKVEQLASDLSRVASELEKSKELISKLEAAPSPAQVPAENRQDIGFDPRCIVPYPVVPMRDKILTSESFVVNGCEVEIFRTQQEFLLQVEDLTTSKIYFKMITDGNVKVSTLNMFTSFGSFYDYVVEMSKSATVSESIVFPSEGKISITGPKKKFTITLEQAEQDTFAACERAVKKFTDKAVDPQFLFEKRMKEVFRRMFDQEKKLTNMVFETAMKLEQVEKTVEDM